MAKKFKRTSSQPGLFSEPEPEKPAAKPKETEAACPKCGRTDIQKSLRNPGLWYCVVCNDGAGDNFYFAIERQ